MRPGWNPARRNRNAGTKANGLGKQNYFGIPVDRQVCYFEKLVKPVLVRRMVGDKEIAFLVEPVRPGYGYPCTIDDIVCVMSQVPAEHRALIDLIVLRQSTRKQEIHEPVWGRAVFHYERGTFSGMAIVLEARSSDPYAFGNSIDPERMRELERLTGDGHAILRGQRKTWVHSSASSLRNTVLFRTLLHELGHCVDYALRSKEQYYLRPRAVREDFAHRYATEAQVGLQRFDPVIDIESLAAEGLEPAWFGVIGSRS